MGAKKYNDLSQVLSMSKLLIPAEEDVNKNRLTDAEDFFREFRKDKKMLDHLSHPR
jgi:hypothetical protein